MSGYPVLSTRSNFAPSYLCLSPPLSSTSTARVAKLSMPGRLFRPLQLSETSWQLASKGRLVIPRNAFENLSVGHKSSRAFLQLGKAKRSEFSQGISSPPGSINRFVRRPIPPTDSRFSRTRPLRLFLSLTRIRSYRPACKCHARRSNEISFLSRYGPANFLIALSRGLVSLTAVLLLAHGSSLSGSPFLPRARIGRETRELCRSPPRE